MGVRVDQDTHRRLLAMRESSGASLGELVRRALGGLEAELDTARWTARAKGVEEGAAAGLAAGRAESQAALTKWRAALKERDDQLAGARDRLRQLEAERVTYPCAGCGQPIPLVAGSNATAEVLAYLRSHRWGHAPCLDYQ